MRKFHLLLSSVNLWALHTSCSEVKTGQALSWSWPFFRGHEFSHITPNSLHPWTLFISLVFSGLACVGSLPLYLSTVFCSKLAVWHMIQQRKIKKGTEQTAINRNEKDKRASQYFPPALLLLLFFHSLYLVLAFIFLTLCHPDFKHFKSVPLSLLQA